MTVTERMNVSGDTSDENGTPEHQYEYSGYDYELSERDFLPPALPVEVKVLLVLTYLAIIIISIVGNAMVICIICGYHKMRTVTNTFLGSLAVSLVTFLILFIFSRALLLARIDSTSHSAMSFGCLEVCLTVPP